MMAWLNGELLILYSSYYRLLLSAIVHLLGGGVHLMNLILLSMYCECGFEGLLCVVKRY